MKKEGLRLAAALLVLMGAVAGCGSSSKTYSSEMAYETAYDTAGYDYVASNTATAAVDTAEYDMAAAEEMDPLYNSDSADSQSIANESGDTSDRKLIKTVDMYVETENYDTLLTNLAKQVSELGGYIEYQYEYNGRTGYDFSYNDSRNANWSIRIPKANLDEFIVKVDEETNIVNKTERITDVTLQYVDLESHKNALLTEQKRLLELLEQAENVEDIIAIEQRLSEVRYELENMESQLRVLDNQIDYSTVNLNIQEVKREIKIEENSIWDRIRNGLAGSIYNLGDSIVNAFVWVIVNIPYLIVWGIIIAVVIIIFRKIMKKRAEKKHRKMQQWAEGAAAQLEAVKQSNEGEKEKDGE